MYKRNQLKINKNIFIDRIGQDLLQYYDVIRELGRGSYGRVYEVKHKIGGEIRACKQLPKSNIKNKEKFMQEIEIMFKTDHPNIIKLYEIYEDDRYFYLVMEECFGGELFDMILKHIQSGKMYREKEAANIIKQLMSAINYCHSNKICHRDLKPENILFTTNDCNSLIKVIDFGLSRIWNNSKMNSKVGTVYYVSPEVLYGNYNEKCDIWSAGVILYILLSGEPPFNGVNDNEICRNIIKGSYEFPKNKWKNISPQAIDLISKMICKEDIRLSASEILEHEWFNIVESKESLEDLNINVELFKNYVEANNMKKMILTYIAANIDDKDVIYIKKEFDKFDKNHNGSITLKEFQEVFSKIERISTDKLKKMFKAIDTNLNGEISYNEFLACAIDQHLYLKEQSLYSAFKAMDKDNNGIITKCDLLNLLKNEDECAINNLIRSVDKNGDGYIDYNEFLDAMGNYEDEVM